MVDVLRIVRIFAALQLQGTGCWAFLALRPQETTLNAYSEPVAIFEFLRHVLEICRGEMLASSET
jgi:hypothetical protein